jgi:hypothetical protein
MTRSHFGRVFATETSNLWSRYRRRDRKISLPLRGDPIGVGGVVIFPSQREVSVVSNLPNSFAVAHSVADPKVARQSYSCVSASVLAQTASWLRYQHENAAFFR